LVVLDYRVVPAGVLRDEILGSRRNMPPNQMVANNGRTGSPTGYAGRRGHPQQFRVAGDGPVRYYSPTRRPQFLEAKKSMTVMFKVGEKVVYPAHGVGVIEGIQTRVVSGSERKFYMLRILDSDMTIMIPTENVNAVGLRRIIGKDMVAKVYRILRDKKVEIDQQTWNRRYREYTEKIKTGSVLEIAKVLRDLFVLKGDKELSFGERKMLDTARNLLVKELAIAKSYSEEKIMEELRTIFAN
jgi:CarD family transcriptional regulator